MGNVLKAHGIEPAPDRQRTGSWKNYRSDSARGESLRWHSNHRVFADFVPGDRLWVVTSGKALEHDDKSGGYLVAMWPVAQVIENPVDDPEYPARKFGHRVLVNETEAIHLDQPVCVDYVIRGEGYDQGVSIGRFLRGPRRLSDEKVRQSNERLWWTLFLTHRWDQQRYVRWNCAVPR